MKYNNFEDDIIQWKYLIDLNRQTTRRLPSTGQQSSDMICLKDFCEKSQNIRMLYGRAIIRRGNNPMKYCSIGIFKHFENRQNVCCGVKCLFREDIE